MFKSENDFKKLIDRLNIDNKPNPAHRKNLRRQMLSAFNETKQKHLARQTLIRTIMKNPLTKPAAAAAVIIAVGLFLVHRGPDEQIGNDKILEVTKCPADMQTILSLNIAYRRGGIAAVDRQCKKVIEMLGPRPAEMTIKQILTEFNGT